MLVEAVTRRVTGRTYLLHDARLALREGDVPTRLVLDELDFDLASLAARLVVVVVIVVGGGACPRPLHTARLASAIAILEVVVLVVGRVGVVGDDFRRHPRYAALGDFSGDCLYLGWICQKEGKCEARSATRQNAEAVKRESGAAAVSSEWMDEYRTSPETQVSAALRWDGQRRRGN